MNCFQFEITSKCSERCRIVVSPLFIWLSTWLFIFLFPPQGQLRLADRRETDQKQQLFQLRSIKASVKEQEHNTGEKQKVRKANQEAEKSQPRRLGRLKYAERSPTTCCRVLKGSSSDLVLHFDKVKQLVTDRIKRSKYREVEISWLLVCKIVVCSKNGGLPL